MSTTAAIEKKVWGTTQEIFHSPHCSVHLLRTIAGTCCSRHYHKQRANRFVVLSGRIAVVVFNSFGDGVRSREILWPGQQCDVRSMVHHRFEVIEAGELIEVYWPDREGGEVERDDIVRIDEGRVLRREEVERVAVTGK